MQSIGLHPQMRFASGCALLCLDALAVEYEACGLECSAVNECAPELSAQTQAAHEQVCSHIENTFINPKTFVLSREVGAAQAAKVYVCAQSREQQ